MPLDIRSDCLLTFDPLGSPELIRATIPGAFVCGGESTHLCLNPISRNSSLAVCMSALFCSYAKRALANSLSWS